MIKTITLLGALLALGCTQGQLRNSYGLPVVQLPAQYDTPQVIIPSTSYGSPIAPSPTYGIPANYQVPIAKIPIRNTYSFDIPKNEPTIVPTYGVPAAPVAVYGVPQEVYGPPPTPTTTTTTPAPPVYVYSPPATTPTPVYGPPASDPIVPAQVYGPPAQVYGPPPVLADTYGPPPSVFQYYGVPAEQVGLVPTVGKIENTNGLVASAGSPSETVGVHSGSSGTIGQVFVPSSVIPIPAIVQPQPPTAPATFVSPPRQHEDINEETVFCL